MKSILAAILPLLCSLALAHQEPSIKSNPARPWESVGKPSGELPPELKDVGITENLGGQIDLGLSFQNEDGQNVQLKQYFSGQKPVLLAFVYYDCPGLCNFLLNGVTESLRAMEWRLGNQFDMVVVSIDPKETPDLAAKKKANYMKELGQPEAASGWHFLVGKEENIKALTKQVGFNYQWDKVSKQWAHTAASYVISPAGKISRYLYGITYDPKTVRLSLVEASEGKVGTFSDHLILTCFQYNPDKRGYAFYAYNIVRAGAGVAVAIAAAMFIPTWLREKRKTKAQGALS